MGQHRVTESSRATAERLGIPRRHTSTPWSFVGEDDLGRSLYTPFPPSDDPDRPVVALWEDPHEMPSPGVEWNHEPIE